GDYEQLIKEGPKVYRQSPRGLGSPDAQAFAQHLSLALEPFGVKVDQARAQNVFANVAAVDAPASKAPITTLAQLEARVRSHPDFDRCQVGEGASHKLSLAHALHEIL